MKAFVEIGIYENMVLIGTVNSLGEVKGEGVFISPETREEVKNKGWCWIEGIVVENGKEEIIYKDGSCKTRINW
jgi:hypothetical protein